MNSMNMPVAVVIGATSKWQADGRNTHLAHGKALDDQDMPVGMRWGTVAQWRRSLQARDFCLPHNTHGQQRGRPRKPIRDQGGDCMIVELDLASDTSISTAFATIRSAVGDRASSSTTRVISKVVIYRRRKNCSNISR